MAAPGLYLHPFDWTALEVEHGGLERLVQLGFGDFAMASAYHAGRWLTPWRADGRVRFLQDGTVHFPPGACYDDMQPVASDQVPAASGASAPFAEFVKRVRAAGKTSAAWTVAYHNSRLGRERPDECVRNAYGDVYTYGLCPARPGVRAYGLRLAADVASQGVDIVELEAFGWMGFSHGSHHFKTSFAPDRALDFLLSYCFCDACVTGIATHGGDPARARTATRGAIDARIREGDAMAPERSDDADALLREVLGSTDFDAMMAHRTAVLDETLCLVRDAAPAVRIAAHVRADPLFTGSQFGMPLASALDRVDEVIYTHYGDNLAKMRAHHEPLLGTLSAEQRSRVRVAFWPKSPQFGGVDDVRALAAWLGDAGLGAPRVYHLGLLPWKTIETVAEAFR